MVVCEICGNEFEYGTSICPYCDNVSSAPLVPADSPLERTVNLEKGMPTVAQALQRLETELATARRQGYRVLTLIHGYGSSGKGGAIKKEVQRQLQFYKHQGRLNEVISGKNFSRHTGAGRQLLRRFPALSAHRDLNRVNRGITLVVL